MKRFLYLEIYRQDRRAIIAHRFVQASKLCGLALRYALALTLGAAAAVAFIPSALAFVLALILGVLGFFLWPGKAAK